MDVRNNLINGATWSGGANKYIFKFKRALKTEKLYFTDFYNLINGAVHPREKRAHFKVQTSPKVGKSKFYQFSCAIVHFVTRGKREHFHVQISPKSGKPDFTNFPTSVTTLLMASVGLEGKTGTFSSLNDPQSRKNQILSIFVGKQANFQVQMSPKAGKTRFYQFSCEFLVIGFQNFFCQNFSLMSFTTLLMASVGTKGKTSAFSKHKQAPK
ncbi:hypothetical protein H5410_056094 [Solanum commersonii]|uniref:Uncharacterized protein n=1 Tax=Solanum commersonii TaxID=4109 RepID=A0A9J5WLQ0_SOLCO|nr:hypothetical protein H5410_056094 [Solanum commersonii]